MTKRRAPSQIRPGAFTLIELLTVVAIFLILAALAGPAISGTLKGMRINSALRLAIDEIQLARATALARNAPVDVWLLKESDQYRILRSSLLNPDSSSQWISRSRIFPEGVAFASAEDYSNLIGSQTVETPPDSPSGSQGIRLRIFPSGRVELPAASAMAPNTTLFLTIVSNTGFDPNSAGDLPANFATVQVNPINGRISTFRP